jgi:uncharacterized protein DUF4136
LLVVSGNVTRVTMRSPKSHVSIVAAFVVALLALSTGCATMNVGSSVVRGADLKHYRTWEWAAEAAEPTGDARLDNSPFFQNHVRGAVEHQLTGKGYVRSTLAGSPDLLVHYHANFSKTFEVTHGGAATGSCYRDCEPEAYAYEQGTLVIDVIDARTEAAVWRGWSRDNMEGAIDNQGRMEQEIDAAVAGMFKQFPSRP